MTSHDLVNLAIYSCYGSIFLFFLSLTVRSEILEKYGSYSAYCGFLFLTVGYMLRCKNYYDLGYRHFWVTDLFDMAVLFSWAILLVIILLDIRFNYRIIGAFLVPFSLWGAAWAQLKFDEPIVSLNPILMKSYWLLPHSMTLSLSCAAFAIACGISIMCLFCYKGKFRRDNEGLASRFPPLDFQDSLRNKVLNVGFVLLMLSIFTGIMFSKQTWGVYWSWDSKETWSVVNWITYLIILYFLKARGWAGKPAAWLSICGFIVIIFGYIGVNVLFNHSCC
jgi:cytochrome c-type biogenesis protein CcsB